MKQRRFEKMTTFLAFTALLVAALPLAAANGKVNINEAEADSLALLPRVGPVVAERIVAFRSENGRFSQIEDLMLVQGIGERTFQLIEPWIVLSGETTLKEKVGPPREGDEGSGD